MKVSLPQQRTYPVEKWGKPAHIDPLNSPNSIDGTCAYIYTTANFIESTKLSSISGLYKSAYYTSDFI